MKKLVLTISMFLALSTFLWAQESSGDLGKKLANPVASMISMPFQTNTEFGIGEFNGSRFTTNIQPVLPFQISENLNLITRAVVPVINQYDITGAGESQTGIGDALITGFLSPVNSGKVIWGVGPNVLMPTGTQEALSTKKWGLGASGVVLTQTNGFTFGALLNHTWSVAGDAARPNFSQTYFQPFAAYNWPSGAGITFAQFEMSKEWESGAFIGSYNPMVSMVSVLGKLPVSMAIGPRVMFGKDNPADWGMRASLTFIFSK
ncbi:hypothetical protein OU798_14615 [Prolixibacteraceae bacterium Z1-6]|uniref:Transporter n=1 Tax=Draconibacterium aestuarii TaxID=2998507 RepID=A0A9X3FA54_9BACT|nr:hypothetical protein [Prolixibacteraceae bacterium Z1-6]